MPSSPSGNTTTVQKSDPWIGEQNEIYQGLNSASNLYKANPDGPSYYPGNTYAGLNDYENGALGNLYNTGTNGTAALNAAQNGVTQTASGNALAPSVNAFNQSQGALSNYMNGTGTGEGLLGSLQSNLNPSSNPALQSAEQSTLSTVLPQIQSGFNAGGRSDSGLAASAAANGATQAIGNLEFGQYNTNVQNALSAAQQQQTSGLAAAAQAGTNYNSGVSAINQAGLVAPGLNNAALTGEQTAFGAGQAQQTDAQNQITADQNRYDYQQQQPYNALSTFENEVNGSGAQGGTVSQSSPYFSNTFGNVASGLAGLGAAASGLSSAGLFSGSGLLSASSLAALPLISDRRLKEDIHKIGDAKNGLAIYAFNYKGMPQTHIGFMADEVEKVHPDAVVTHPSGYKMVDYGRASMPAKGKGLAGLARLAA